MDNKDHIKDYKTSISESLKEIIRVLKQANSEIIPRDSINEATSEVLIEILFKELETVELETRSILSEIIDENNTTVKMSDSDLELYKMIVMGEA